MPIERVFFAATASSTVGLALLARGAWRMKAHFHDRHYSPAAAQRRLAETGIGDRPLSWWAVRRVLEYSGRANIWLAGGFGLVYAAYILLGDSWPAWMGTMVFP